MWTLLTVALIFYILKNQEKRDLRQEEREIKYQNIISNLTEKLNLVEDIREDVSEIKSYVFNKEA
ncbi:BhlA/UviB family holin-like peptide [Tepidibacter formicigenes]|uniref:BhlA/UviB family holin-like peptide n=1 Tax=Tepidibacter formicigenes TaxID=227138 RepID=UPI001FA8C045